MTETERLILTALRELDATDLDLMARGKLQMRELADLCTRMKAEDGEPRPGCCAYHGSGGPKTLACGGDIYNGYGARGPKIEALLALGQR